MAGVDWATKKEWSSFVSSVEFGLGKSEGLKHIQEGLGELKT